MSATSQAAEVSAPVADGMVEVVLTLRPSQYREMGADIEALRRQLDLPASASNTQVIIEAVHRLAGQG